MFRSKFFSVVSVTLISTPFVTSGVQYQLSINVYPDMRSSAVSPRSSPAILLQLAA